MKEMLKHKLNKMVELTVQQIDSVVGRVSMYIFISTTFAELLFVSFARNQQYVTTIWYNTKTRF